MISMDKEYRTRDGREVRVLCVDKRGSGYPVVALLKSPNGRETIDTFSSCGMRIKTAELGSDLIEVKPRIVREFWKNIYPDYEGCSRKSREVADAVALPDRIACIKFSIDCEHGEGLNDKESQ